MLKYILFLSNLDRICYKIEDLLECSKSTIAWSLPSDWIKICEKLPSLVRNKVNENNNNDANRRPNFYRHKSLDIPTYNPHPVNHKKLSLAGEKNAFVKIENNNLRMNPVNIVPLPTSRNITKDQESVTKRLNTITRSTSLCD